MFTCSQSSDIYAFGSIVYYLMTDIKPWDKFTQDQLKAQLFLKKDFTKMNKIECEHKDFVKDILVNCMNYDPMSRLTE